MAAYLISRLDVSDPAAIAEYARRAPESIERYGGKYLVRRGDVTVLEGEWNPTLVIVEFPTVEAARQWYASPEYQAVRHSLFRGAERDLVIVDGA
ncbi:MAG TPA: DUF1330 domain-containing protein [Kofleriaceae bacterium]|jgi:uncharacterized protein (DUF1330 family)